MVANGQIARRRDQIKGILSEQSFMNSLKDVLPKHLTPERIVKMVLVAASRQPKIFECTDASIIKAAITCGQLGLDCSGTLGQGYLVPYFNGKIKKLEVQFIPGYQGLISLARRTEQIRRIESRVVHQNDQFDFEYGFDQRLKHVPKFTEAGPIICVYAIAELSDGSKQLEIMTIEQVEGIRDRSKAKDSGPWKTDFEEMARKTVVRRICKYLPMSIELATAFEADNQQYEIHQQQTQDVTAGVAGTKERLKKVQSKVVEKQQPKEEPDPATEAEKEKQIAALDAAEEADKKKTKKKAKVKKWQCIPHGHPFDEPTENDLCPTCLTDDITLVEDLKKAKA